MVGVKLLYSLHQLRLILLANPTGIEENPLHPFPTKPTYPTLDAHHRA